MEIEYELGITSYAWRLSEVNGDKSTLGRARVEVRVRARIWKHLKLSRVHLMI